ARRYRMVVLLKGAGSIVATPGGAWTIIGEGAPVLASAGTGDVLAGMIGALLARGAPAAEAACVAAWLHGRAGTRFELAHGHAEGLGAVELPALLRGTLDELARTAWRHRCPARRTWTLRGARWRDWRARPATSRSSACCKANPIAPGACASMRRNCTWT